MKKFLNPYDEIRKKESRTPTALSTKNEHIENDEYDRTDKTQVFLQKYAQDHL